MNNPQPKILETISSWLDLEDNHHQSNFNQELQDLQMLDEFLFNFSNPTITNYSDPLPDLPGTELQSILDDLHEFDNPPPPPPPQPPQQPNTDKPTSDSYYPSLTTVPEQDECDTFLNITPDSPTQSIAVDQFFQSDDVIIISNSSSSTSEINYHNHQQQSMNTNTGSPGDDNDDDEEEVEDESNKRGTLNCKNLVSERNRRKRLSQQLLSLRALVPNITKMDKRSVLVDALSYLKNMQEETARIQEELDEQQLKIPRDTHFEDDNSSGNDRTPRNLATIAAKKGRPQIIEIEVEKMEEKRFIVKITCKGSNCVGGDVLRLIESLGFEITFGSLDQIKPQHILTTIFIKVKKEDKMTEEKLKDCIISSALRSGLTLHQTSC